MDAAVPAHHRGKIKRKRKNKQMFGFYQGAEKAENMTMTVIQNVVCALGKIPKGQEKRKSKMKNGGIIETTALLRYNT